jgi:hypothetical protein
MMDLIKNEIYKPKLKENRKKKAHHQKKSSFIVRKN